MKKLKDYLGKKVAIACRTDAEAKFVNDFLANNGGRSLYRYWEDRKNYSKEYHNCIEFNLDDLPYNCYCYEGYYEKEGYDVYEVYEASEFMESNTSLVGRYVKTLVDKPSSIGFCKKGDCYLIEEDDTNILCIKNVITQIGNWLISKKLIGVEWELMPIGFNPNQSEEPFAIQLNNQEELDAIMSFYKEKGYSMYGFSNYYHKGFVVYIKPEDKTWQTAHSNDRKYPFKTLSELGIKVNTNPKFVAGKWYKASLKEGIFYLKLLKQEKNKIWASEQISTKNSIFVKEPTLCFDNNVNYKTDKYELLTDLSEIQQYLPLGHPDKIANSSMYKVGDFVLANGSEGAGGWSSQVVQLLDLSIGSKQGGKFDRDSDFVAKLSNGETYIIANSNIERKAKLEEIKTDLLSKDELLQVAKQFYPIGTKFRTIYGDDKLLTVTENNHINSRSQTDIIAVSTDKGCGTTLYKSAAIWSKSKGWAKIINSPIQESDNFVLPEKWCIKRNTEGNDIVTDWINNKFNADYMDKKFSDDYYYSNGEHGSELYGIEINFEQFEKYVLGKSEVMEKSWAEVSLDMMQKSLVTNYLLTPNECYTSKNLLNPEIIPIKVRNLPKFETPTRVKTVIIEPELLKI